MPFRPTEVLPRGRIMELLRLAGLAPSGHNTQPWKFSVDKNVIRIFPDFTRQLPVVDPDNHALYISLGCALENLVIAALHMGLEAEVEYFPPHEPEECLLVRLAPGEEDGDPNLFKAIPLRQSTRSCYSEHNIPLSHLHLMESASRREGIGFQLFTEPGDILKIMELVKDGIRRQFNNPAFLEELSAWIRFNPKEAETRRDGLSAPTIGFSPVPRWLGKLILRSIHTPQHEAKRAEQLIRSSSELMLFTAEKNEKAHWIDLGRSFERVALTATSLNIKHAHMNSPCEVVEVRRELQKHLGLEEAQPLLLIRIGYGKTMPRSPRRPVHSLLV